MATNLKPKRDWLENIKDSNSWYKLELCDYDGVTLTLADCSRSITWYFGKKDGKDKGKRGKAKIAKVKKLVDEIYNYYHEDNK